MREIERDREWGRKKDRQTNRDFAAGPIVSVSLFIAGFQREREGERERERESGQKNIIQRKAKTWHYYCRYWKSFSKRGTDIHVVVITEMD